MATYSVHQLELDASAVTWHLNPRDTCLDISDCSGHICKDHAHAGMFADEVGLGSHVDAVDISLWVPEHVFKVGVGLRECGSHEGEEGSPRIHVELWILASI